MNAAHSVYDRYRFHLDGARIWAAGGRGSRIDLCFHLASHPADPGHHPQTGKVMPNRKLVSVAYSEGKKIASVYRKSRKLGWCICWHERVHVIERVLNAEMGRQLVERIFRDQQIEWKEEWISPTRLW